MQPDLEKYRKPTSTSVNLEKYRKPATPEPPKDVFFKSLVKDAAETLLVKPAARTAELVGRTGILGENIKRGYEEMSKTGEGQRLFGIDVEAQKALGQGGAKQIGGEALKATSWLYGGGKAAQVGGATLKGQMLRGFIQGAKGGAVGGATYAAGSELQEEGSTTSSVLKEGAVGGAIGLATGGVLGGLLPVPVAAARGGKDLLKPENIMQRVARINAGDERKFQQAAKESVGEYLVKRGIYGNDEEIMTQLVDRFTRSKSAADDALTKLPGTYRPKPVQTALKDMLEREMRISSPGAPSRDLAKVSQLAQKYDTQGLSMTEINEVKRIFERNNRLDYLKQNLPESIAKANTLDDAIREWQFETAQKLGLKNLAELNRETRLAKQLGDSLFKKNVGSSANNALSLTDAVLLSGGDPQAVNMLIARKIGGNKRLQSAVARRLAGEPTVGLPKAVFGEVKQGKNVIPSVVLPRNTAQTTLDLRSSQGAAMTAPTQLSPESRPPRSPLPPTILPVREVSTRGRGQAKLTPKQEENILRDLAKKNKIDFDQLSKKVDEKLSKAETWKNYVDSEAQKVVQGLNDVKVAPAPIKSKKRILEKTLKEEGGDLEKIKDIARNTIVPSTPKARAEVFKRMDIRKDLFRPRKDQKPEDFMGYEGAIYNIKTPDGQIVETQVVTPEMTYGKNDAEFSKKVLGEDVFNEIQKRTGLEPGKGHEYYETWRKMSLEERLSKKGQDLLKTSFDYYSKLR